MSEKRFTIKSTATELELYDNGVKIGEFPHYEWVARPVDYVVKTLNEQQSIIQSLKEENEQLRAINKEIGDDLYNCRINKNIIREKLKLWQDVHKEYNIYNINDFEELMRNDK